MSLQTTLTQLRKAKAAILMAEDEIESLMKEFGIKPAEEPKRPGRPMGSKNRPKVSPLPPEQRVG